jgi:hypothetical protein
VDQLMRVCLLLALIGCSSQTVAGDACATADDMRCGQSAGGTDVALLCSSMGSQLQWAYLVDCEACNVVRNDPSELQCGGLNRASEGLHCDLQKAGACAVANPTHVLSCDGTNIWSTAIDCSTAGKSCGKLLDGTLGCV